MKVKLKILFFAKSREIVGKQIDTIIVPEVVSYEKLLNLITKQYSLEVIKNNLILALNEEYCSEGQVFTLKQGDEVAVIPPLSGAPNCGAVSLFVGTTRDNFEDKKVLKLEYEVYESMAEKCMKEICTQMRQTWSQIENIAIHHRLGEVPVKEASVIIAVSSPHRADAIEATQWCINKLKETVPIWKKEVYVNNESQWKENVESNNFNKIQTQQHVISSDVSSHLIQITCSNEELQRRMEAFMLRKRTQANIANMKDFCGVQDTSNSCARVDAKLKRQKHSKSHLLSQRVFNTYGPYNVKPLERKSFISRAVEQRINDIESCLDISKPVSPDIYQRLKQIEDRMLFLESVSPEYAMFWNKSALFGNIPPDNTHLSPTKKLKHTIYDLNKYIFELEEQVHSKK